MGSLSAPRAITSTDAVSGPRDVSIIGQPENCSCLRRWQDAADRERRLPRVRRERDLQVRRVRRALPQPAPEQPDLRARDPVCRHAARRVRLRGVQPPAGGRAGAGLEPRRTRDHGQRGDHHGRNFSADDVSESIYAHNHNWRKCPGMFRRDKRIDGISLPGGISDLGRAAIALSSRGEG